MLLFRCQQQLHPMHHLALHQSSMPPCSLHCQKHICQTALTTTVVLRQLCLLHSCCTQTLRQTHMQQAVGATLAVRVLQVQVSSAAVLLLMVSQPCSKNSHNHPQLTCQLGASYLQQASLRHISLTTQPLQLQAVPGAVCQQQVPLLHSHSLLQLQDQRPQLQTGATWAMQYSKWRWMGQEQQQQTQQGRLGPQSQVLGAIYRPPAMLHHRHSRPQRQQLPPLLPPGAM